MKIIAGKWKGKNLCIPKEGTRPSMDKTRQAFFNILQNVIDGATVLDLFAGSASISLEAISRGAKQAIAVEVDSEACRIIKQNIATVKTSQITVVESDVLKYLTQARLSNVDLVFSDPPYEKNFKDSLLLKSMEHSNLPNMLNSDALFVAESPTKLSANDLSLIPQYWNIITQRKYGKAHLTILQFSKSTHI